MNIEDELEQGVKSTLNVPITRRVFLKAFGMIALTGLQSSALDFRAMVAFKARKKLR